MSFSSFYRASARLLLAAFIGVLICAGAQAQDIANYKLAPGDLIRLLVFQNPDLTLDTRVSEDGSVNIPLVGPIKVGQLDIPTAEKKIAKALKEGGFLKDPQVNLQLVEVRGNKVSVLGQVNKPGSFPLQSSQEKVSQALADAGGITALGDDRVIVTGTRRGTAFRREVDIDSLYRDNHPEDDIDLLAGDAVYVPRAPSFYIYGEVMKPGNYRVDRSMTMRQAIAAGGGLTLRGTERRLKVVRTDAQGKSEKISVGLDDPVFNGDVLYVAESIF